jgi:hypothetical protein
MAAPAKSLSPPSGHVYRRHGQRGDVWYARYRLPDGRQVKRRIGPVWTDRGRPGPGFHTRRTAQAWLDETLAQARRGTLPGMVRTGATFAEAVTEYMRWLEHDRQRKPSALRDYNSIIRADGWLADGLGQASLRGGHELDDAVDLNLFFVGLDRF